VNGFTLQLAGKDQVRFQSIMWQAMLMSAGLPATKQVFYHGFITSGGQKMSKSLGNVIDPIAIVDEYGTDALRYFLARHVHPFEDSDVTMERFKEAYNADLANGIGNTVARVMQLSETNNVQTAFMQESLPGPFADSLERYDYNEACNYIQDCVRRLDRKINEEESFKVIKKDPIIGKAMIQFYVQEMRRIAQMLASIMPAASESMMKSIKENKKPENLFPRKE
jgi:methionyl-tRNA synthetase